jgi:hypothetical protein
VSLKKLGWILTAPKLVEVVLNQLIMENTMISITCIQIVKHMSSIKDNVVLAGLILELLNSVTDSVNKE